MANLNIYRGEETLCEIGIQGESLDKTDCTTAVTPTITLREIQELSIKMEENIKRDKFINGAGGRNVTDTHKESHDASAKMKLRVSKDFAQTDALEGFMLPLAIDGLGTDATNVYTFPAVANEYGTDYLKVFTLEAGLNKTSNIINQRLTGCIVNKEKFHCEENKFCEWDWEILAIKGEMLKAWSAGSLAESTENCFNWGDVKVSICDAGGSPLAIDGIKMFEHNIDNKVKAERDLANATSTRCPTMFTLGRRDISGSMKLMLTTATDSGQDLWEIMFGDSSGTASPSETVTLKDLQCYLYIDGTYYAKYTYHDVTFSTIDKPLEGDGIAEVTIPWTAKHIVLEMKMHTSVVEPTNWS